MMRTVCTCEKASFFFLRKGNRMVRAAWPLSLAVLFQLLWFQSVAQSGAGSGSGTAGPELRLPPGFRAEPFARDLGRNRHIAVNDNGDVYVKLERLADDKGILVLRRQSGQTKVIQRFGDFPGTGIAISNGYVYAASNSEVYRYKLNSQNMVDENARPERIITGLVDRRQHAAKTFALDGEGNIYVNIGAPSNSCQEKDRQKGSLGMNPCSLLDSSGGIWKFRVDKPDQTYADGERYATGIRNAVGLTWNKTVNELYAMQHGRDGLFQMFPELYDEEEGAELPSEELFLVKKGSNFGWPYCYYDHRQQKKLLAPEYGGDKKKQGQCALADQPIAAFPGHWGPNAIVFYTGNMFPEKYRNGAFIAFHGSWNRAPRKQEGYKVVFLPFRDGKPSGEYEVFADGFKGAEEISAPGQAETRPCGLAVGPDGALYVSDSVKGHIWRIVYGQ